MSWTITGTEKNPTDPFRSQVSLLLHGDGANGSTTIIDSSPNPKTITAVGDAQISTAQSKFGGASIAFDGSGDYLVGNSPNLSGNWTIETWVYPVEQNRQQTIISFSSGGFTGINIWMNPSRQAVLDNGQTAQSAFTGGTFTLNQWQHFALSRLSGTSSVFINGTLVGSNGFSPLGINAFTIAAQGGANVTPGSPFNGFLDDIRVTVGIARYETGTGANVNKMVFAGTNTLALLTAPFPDI